MTPDQWLDDQLKKMDEDEAITTTSHSVFLVAQFALATVKHRMGLAIALLIMATGYSIHNLLVKDEHMTMVRSKSDEEIRHMMAQLTMADLESLFSQFGVELWRSLWRLRR